MNGNAIVFASSVGDTNTARRTGGILFIGNNATGNFYGSSVTITDNVVIPSGYTLNVPAGSTLTIPSNKTLTNNGTISLTGPFNGTFINNGTLNIPPIFLPENPRLEYRDCGKLAVRWDVETGYEWEGAGNVKIEMSGAFTKTEDVKYTAGMTGVEIDIPKDLLSEAENPLNRTFTATLFREPVFFKGQSTKVDLTLNMAYQRVSEANVSSSGNSSFTIDWQVDNGYVCNSWKYAVVVKQGELTHKSVAFPVSEAGKAVVSLPKDFSPFEPLEINLELNDADGALMRRNVIKDLDNHQFVLVDESILSMLSYKIGDIPDQSVWHGGDGFVGFIVYTDKVADKITLSCTKPDFPVGIIEFNKTTGVFLYYPDMSAGRDFTVTFTAESAGKVIDDQMVRFTMMAATLPDFAAFGINSGKEFKSDDNYTVEVENPLGTKPFNTVANKPVSSVSISGKELVFDKNAPNSFHNWSNQDYIYDLNLYAEKVIIREPLFFRQTNVTIYAKELVFEGAGSINTSPVELSTPSATGANGAKGENAGNITLYIKDFKQSSPQVRFISIGGKGQNTQQAARTPGNGGDGGTLTSTIDVSAFSNLTRGSAGIRIVNNVYNDVGINGSTGNFVTHTGKFTWLHPNLVAAVVKYAKDAYLNQYNGFAFDVFTEYTQEIVNMKASGEWVKLEDFEQMELSIAEDEMRAVMFRINQNLDFFGNPFGWVPLLSFEVNKAAFEGEIEKAMRVMYLNYWLTHIANSDAQRKQGYEQALNFVREELVANQSFITQLADDIGKLEKKASDLEFDIEDV